MLERKNHAEDSKEKIHIHLPDKSSLLAVKREFYYVPDVRWKDDSTEHFYDLFTSRNMLTEEKLLPEVPAVKTLIHQIEVDHQIPIEDVTSLFRIHIWRIYHAATRLDDLQSRHAYNFLHSLAENNQRLAYVSADGGPVPTKDEEVFAVESDTRYVRVQEIINELSQVTDGNSFRYHGIYFNACNPKNMPVTATRIPVVVHTDINDISTGFARVLYPAIL